MNSIKAEGMPKYTGPTDCLIQTVRSEGIGSLYNGFMFLWMRIGPWAVIMFVTWDWSKDLYRKKYMVSNQNHQNSLFILKKNVYKESKLYTVTTSNNKWNMQ